MTAGGSLWRIVFTVAGFACVLRQPATDLRRPDIRRMSRPLDLGQQRASRSLRPDLGQMPVEEPR